MADRYQNKGYRFLPYSMQKLTDLDSMTKVENYSREMNMAKLKEDILKNIEMIFISKSHFFDMNDKVPEDIYTSVVCLGLDDYTGKRLNNDLIMELETNIIEQLKYFEPRINPETIDVDVKIKNNGYSCDIVVTGKINMAEINEEIKFKTSFNFETGLSVIEQL